MNNLDELLGKGIEPFIILELIVLNMAWMVVLAVPMGVLFSTLMAFGGMSSTYEITVIKASGGSLVRMMIPVMSVGVLLFYFMYWYNDVVLPESNHQAKVLLNDIKRTKPTLLLEKGRFIQELDGYTILSRKVDSLTGKMYGVTIYDNRSAIDKNIVSADSGTLAFSDDYSRLVLDLKDGEVHQYRYNDVEGYRIIDFKNYQVISRQSGFSFDKSDDELVSRGQRELSIRDMEFIAEGADSSATSIDSVLDVEIKRHIEDYLFTHIYMDTLAEGTNDTSVEDTSSTGKTSVPGGRSVSSASVIVSDRTKLSESDLEEKVVTHMDKARAIDNELAIFKSRVRSRTNQRNDFLKKKREYEVEIYKKYSIPFACFVFILVGCPLGVKTKGGNFGTSAVISLGFYVLFWVCLIGGEKLADEGLLEPWLAMWLGDIVVGGLGIFLMLKVNNENFTIFGSRS